MRILVVDDELNTREYLAQLLSGRSWHVDTAADGPSALAMANRRAYDAAVLDYRMPGMDGAELCRQIEQIHPETRVVLLTAYPTIDTVFPAVDAGVYRVLAKPVDPSELIAALEEQPVR